ncbi:MAG TPA: WecB/TagA/CpsF family glycosyltransferase [Candidatus Dormibacteraeota bacterium]|nr:WecB/TagA/CpsF family glycosyltransferase [Candidatus Dormibacteraeota bacterium]
MSRLEQTRILGVRVDCLDMTSALARIEAFAAGGGHHLVATVNPEFVMRARQDPEFARVLESADLCLADGTGVVWAARRQGCALRKPVAGTDMLPLLASMCARRGFRLFLLGAGPGVADELAAGLRARHPSLLVASHSGSPAPSDDDESVRFIREHGTQVLLVAYGAPNQEKWIDRTKDRMDVAVAMGVGGAFDYLTGRVPRAPASMRRAGLEWLHRLVHQPWRIRRMAVLPVYAIKVMLSAK